MKTLSCLFAVLIASFCISLNGYSQGLTTAQKDKITFEIDSLFNKCLKASESIDLKAMTDNVDDSMRAGFIVNARFMHSFEEVMADFKENIKGCESQKMNFSNKKITVLGEGAALLTASGDYLLALEDGRTLTGRFAWTFVFSKVNGNWKIIHSHL